MLSPQSPSEPTAARAATPGRHSVEPDEQLLLCIRCAQVVVVVMEGLYGCTVLLYVAAAAAAATAG